MLSSLVSIFSTKCQLSDKIMNEVVIKTLNHLYRKQLLLLSDDTVNDEKALAIAKNPEECCQMKPQCCNIGRKSRNKLYKRSKTKEVMENRLCTFLHALHHISSCRDCDEKNLFSSLRCGTHDCGCQVPSEEDMIESIGSKNDDIGIQVSEFGQTPKDNEQREIDENELLHNSDVPTHAHALDCLETAMRWLERQDECNSQTLLVLKHLRDLAATKKYSELKLKSIVDFFKKQM